MQNKQSQNNPGFCIGALLFAVAGVAYFITLISLFNDMMFYNYGMFLWQLGHGFALSGVFVLLWVVYFNKTVLEVRAAPQLNSNDAKPHKPFCVCAVASYGVAFFAYIVALFATISYWGGYGIGVAFLLGQIGHAAAVFSNLFFACAIYYKKEIIADYCDDTCSQTKEIDD